MSATELQRQLDEANAQLTATNAEVNRLRAEQQTFGNNNAGQRTNEIARVSVKSVPFLADHPDLYFIQIEAQFRSAGITVDQTKYDHAISLFDPKHLSKISDFLRNPPAADRYTAFKARILQEFTDSDQKKLRRLIEGIELGDDKPSQLLKKMKDLAGTALTDDAIKTLFVQRLPETVRGIISIAEGDSTVWAKQADKMMEAAQLTAVSAIATKPSTTASDPSNTLHAEIAELRKQITEMKTNDRGRSRSSGNSNKRRDQSKSSTRPDNKSNKVCYFHVKFGKDARKCAEPCCFADIAASMKAEN